MEYSSPGLGLVPIFGTRDSNQTRSLIDATRTWTREFSRTMTWTWTRTCEFLRTMTWTRTRTCEFSRTMTWTRTRTCEFLRTMTRTRTHEFSPPR